MKYTMNMLITSEDGAEYRDEVNMLSLDEAEQERCAERMYRLFRGVGVIEERVPAMLEDEDIPAPLSSEEKNIPEDDGDRTAKDYADMDLMAEED
jgi:hypothetical protein